MLSIIYSIVLAVNSFVAQFVQQKYSPLFDEPQKSTGVLTYKTPEYLKWEYLSPQSLVWELDGNKGNMPRQLKNMVMLIRESIQGDFEQIKKSFDLTMVGNIITLVPKKREMKNIFSKICITLNPATQIAEKVEIYEAEGDQTIIYFTDVVFLEP